MTRTTTKRNGTGKEHRSESIEYRFEDPVALLPSPTKVGQTPGLLELREDVATHRNGKGPHRAQPLVVALVCSEYPESPIGQYIANVARALARRHTSVHLFSRRPFELGVPGTYDHAIGECEGAGILEQVEDFTRRVGSAYLEQFPDS